MWFEQFRNLFKKYNEEDIVEARVLLGLETKKYRTISYEELTKWVRKRHVDDYSISGNSGTEYQVEVNAYWDDRKGGDVRLMLSIDGGPINANKPVSDSFIKTPDNSFVGEE